MFRRSDPAITIITKSIPTVKVGTIVEDEVFSYDDDPNGIGEYPFVPFFAVFEPSYDQFDWKLQSMLRVIKDPQREMNKRRSKTVDMVDAQLNSGWIAKKGAVEEEKSLFDTKQGKVIFLKPQAQMTDIQRIQSPEIPQSWFALEEMFSKDIMEDAGVNNELFGQSESGDVQTAALLAKQRQGAALVTLQGIFDGIRYSQALLSKKTMKMIQANYGPVKIQRILNQEPTQEFYNQDFGKYDCVVAEGTLTDTQRERTFLGYMNMKASGIPIPDGFIVKSSNLHDSGQLSKYMDEQAQAAAQQEQQQQQIAMQELQARARRSNALSYAEEGQGAERYSRIPENRAFAIQRLADAEAQKEQALLDKVKAVKELQDIDLAQLEKIVGILDALKQQEVAKTAQLTPLKETNVQEPPSKQTP